MSTDQPQLKALNLSEDAWLQSDLDTRMSIAMLIIRNAFFLEQEVGKGDPRVAALIGLVQLAFKIEGAIVAAGGAYKQLDLTKLSSAEQYNVMCDCPVCVAARSVGKFNVH